MNENEIRELLGQGIGEEPPVVGGPAAVFAGARARVVRTRAVTGALSVVAVLGVTAGAVALSGSGRPGRVVAGVTATSASSTPSTAPTTSATTPATTTPPPNTTTPTPLSKLQGTAGLPSHREPAPVLGAGRALMDGRSTAVIVRSRLRPGLVTANYNGQDSNEPAQLGVDTIANMSVDDGTGKPTSLNVRLVQNSQAMDRVTDCTTEQELQSGRVSNCRAEAEPDGSVVLSYSVRDDPSGKSPVTQGLRTNKAVRVFPSGSVVSVAAFNFYSPVNGPQESPSRSIPPISVDELKAIVMDPRWGLTVPAEFAQQAKQDLVPYTDNN